MIVRRGRFWAVVLAVGVFFVDSGGLIAQSSQVSTAKSMQSFSEQIAAAKDVKDLLDINTATAAQLKALPGMGDAYVQRVIAGRPYTAKNQLTTRGILPQSAYEKIKLLIIAHRPK